MEIPGVTADFLTENTNLWAKASVKGIQKRIQFAKKNKPGLLCSERLEDLLLKNTEFSKRGEDERLRLNVITEEDKERRSKLKHELWDKSAIDFISSTLNCTAKWHNMESRVPSLLGSTVDDARARLRDLDYYTSEVKTKEGVVSLHSSIARHTLFFCLPLAVGMDYDSAVRVYSVVNNMDLHKLLGRYPFLLVQDHSLIQENIQKLLQIWTRKQLVDILLQFPLLCCVPLLPSVVQRLHEVVASLEVPRELIMDTLRHAMQPQPSYLRPIPMSPNNILLSSILCKFEVDQKIVQKLFSNHCQHDGEQLHEVIQYLQSKPLSLKDNEIRLLIEECPRLCSISREKLEQHVSSLLSLFSSKELKQNLEACATIMGSDLLVTDKLDVLVEEGVARDTVVELFRQHPTLITHSIHELQNRIRLLLDIPGVDSSYLMKHKHLMLCSVAFIEQRLRVASRVKPELINRAHVEDLLCSNVNKFAHKCEITLGAYWKTCSDQKGSRFNTRGNFSQEKDVDTLPDRSSALDEWEKNQSNRDEEDSTRNVIIITTGGEHIGRRSEMTSDGDFQQEEESMRDLVLRLHRSLDRHVIAGCDTFEEEEVEIEEEEEEEDYLRSMQSSGY